MDDDGRVYVPSYTSWFTPIKILPLQPGKDLLNKLENLECECNDEHTNVDDKYKIKLLYLMPEAIKNE